MAKFDMAQFLSDAGVNLDTEKREQIEYISIDRIVPDSNNFYELSGLEDLAENISLLGLQQPIRVRPSQEDETQYIIISGHRRHAALNLLIEQDSRDDLREVPCIVERGEENPDLQQLKLIYANASTRVLSSAEQAKQAEQVEQILYRLKESGMEFPGRMRDHVAAACQMSTGKLARLKVIRDGLAKEFSSVYESGVISESTAYELARTPQDIQQLIFAAYGNKLPQFGACTVSNIVTNLRNAGNSIPENPCPAGGQCGALEQRQKAAAKLKSWEGLSCRANTCCLNCRYLPTCPYHCEFSKAKKKELRDTAKAAEKEAEKRFKESRQSAIDAITGSWQRTVNLAIEKNIDGRTLFKTTRGWDSPSDDEDMKKIHEGSKIFEYTSSMPGNISHNAINHLIATADLLGCSIDYLLGRTDAPTTAAAPAVKPEKCVNVDTWNTGTPTEPGRYVGLVQYDSSCSLDAEELIWKDGAWELFGETTEDYGIKVIYWAKFPKGITHPLNCGCITGMSPSGHCGAAFYCDSDADCCLQCDEKCSIRCGWIDAGEDD